MPQKRSLIFHKLVSKSNNLLQISVISLTKVNKPIISKLIFIKKSRKLKRFKLLKHYSYGFLGEYQFDDSPSTTPIIHCYNKKHDQLRSKSIHNNIYSMLLWFKCFGCLKAQVRGGGGGGEADSKLALEAYFPEAAINGEEKLYLEEDIEDGSIDERAERFIERFYAEMRLQRQESF